MTTELEMWYSRDAQVASVQFRFLAVERIPVGIKDKEHVNKSPRCTLKNLLKQAGGFKKIYGKQVNTEVL